MKDCIQKRFPDNFSVQIEHGVIIIRDGLMNVASGYFITVEETVAAFRATVRFEDFAFRLFQHVAARLDRNANQIKRLLTYNDRFSLRIYRQSVEKPCETDEKEELGFWIELEMRNKGTEYSKELFVDMLLSLIIQLFPYNSDGEDEGTQFDILQTKFERSHVNRSICLAFHGYNCKACGLGMKDLYGDTAHRFIHVHHLEPLATRPAGMVDPINEMVPLCPNCHSIAHLKSPPYGVDEITALLKNASLKPRNG